MSFPKDEHILFWPKGKRALVLFKSLKVPRRELPMAGMMWDAYLEV
jgi:hypothetical protein